jgi:hypothetical protein
MASPKLRLSHKIENLAFTGIISNTDPGPQRSGSGNCHAAGRSAVLSVFQRRGAGRPEIKTVVSAGDRSAGQSPFSGYALMFSKLCTICSANISATFESSSRFIKAISASAKYGSFVSFRVG